MEIRVRTMDEFRDSRVRVEVTLADNAAAVEEAEAWREYRAEKERRENDQLREIDKDFLIEQLRAEARTLSNEVDRWRDNYSKLDERATAADRFLKELGEAKSSLLRVKLLVDRTVIHDAVDALVKEPGTAFMTEQIAVGRMLAGVVQEVSAAVAKVDPDEA